MWIRSSLLIEGQATGDWRCSKLQLRTLRFGCTRRNFQDSQVSRRVLAHKLCCHRMRNLDKIELATKHQYTQRFESTAEFEWTRGPPAIYFFDLFNMNTMLCIFECKRAFFKPQTIHVCARLCCYFLPLLFRRPTHPAICGGGALSWSTSRV